MIKKPRFGDARDKMLAPPCTMPPRQRDGKTHAGGRSLRRAMTKLGKRQALHKSKEAGQTMPGSMKK